MMLAKTSWELVGKYGGPTEFSRRTGCPIDTAKKYSNRTSSMPDYLVPLVDLGLMAGYKMHWRNVAVQIKK